MAGRDWAAVHRRREAGETWSAIAADEGITPGSLRGQYSVWRKQAGVEAPAAPPHVPESEHGRNVVVELDTVKRVRTLEDLLEVLEVDLEEWRVARFRGNAWEQHSVKKGLQTLLQVRADFTRDPTRLYERLRDELLADMAAHAPPRYPRLPYTGRALDAPALLVLGLFDAHLGMLAWGQEVGADYDLTIAVEEFQAAFRELLELHALYDVERILIPVGNDFLHADTTALGGKGGASTRGTPQDVDTRLAKIFRAGRQALVHAIDQARLVAPVDVVVVPGNHDQASMFKLGEVLQAWYRTDQQVRVVNSPRPRDYYRYGANLIGLTHGEEFQRRRDPLPLLMANEAPQDWAECPVREWLVGHFHAAQELRYLALEEHQGVRVRGFAGLTRTDAWHKAEGYAHRRAGTALVYARSGGAFGLHETYPTPTLPVPGKETAA
jgi:transposase-like protein